MGQAVKQQCCHAVPYCRPEWTHRFALQSNSAATHAILPALVDAQASNACLAITVLRVRQQRHGNYLHCFCFATSNQ